MKNLRKVDTCLNCKHLFTLSEWDCSDQYFCTLDAPERPKCGSSLMTDEMFDFRDREGYSKSLGAWYEWEEGREVEPNHICDGFENGK